MDNFKYIPFPESKPVPALDIKPFVFPKDRPLGERLALALMRRSYLGTRVQEALYDIQSPQPRVADFAPLVADGLAKNETGDWHCLTETGVTAADQVIEAFAKQLGLHHKVVTGGSRFHFSMHCTCGETFQHSRNEGHWGAAQLRIWGKHIVEVESARAKGLPYVPSDIRVQKLIETMFSPPLQPEG